jgi:hypothetical protein
MGSSSRIRVAQHAVSQRRHARKLLTILNAILRDKQPWRPENA